VIGYKCHCKLCMWSLNVQRSPRLGRGRNNAALNAITIYIFVQKIIGRPGAPYTTGEAKWWISWGGREEGQTCGGSVDAHDPSNLEMVPQNRDLSVLRVTVPVLSGTAASLPL